RDDVDERARSPGAIALRHVLEPNRDRTVSLYRQDRQRAAVRHETHEITKHTKTLKYFVSFVFSWLSWRVGRISDDIREVLVETFEEHEGENESQCCERR